jgi:hypothetical protein
VEVRVDDLSSQVAMSKASEASARDSMSRLEERSRADSERLRELDVKAIKLALVEEQLATIKSEHSRVCLELTQMTAMKDELDGRQKATAMRHEAEKQALVKDQEVAAEYTRRAQEELTVHREELAMRAAEEWSTASSRRERRGEGNKTNLVVASSAVAGGISIFALKLLAKAASGNRDA